MDKLEIKLKVKAILEGVGDFEELKAVVSTEEIRGAFKELVEEGFIEMAIGFDGHETFWIEGGLDGY